MAEVPPQPTKLTLVSPEHNLWMDEFGRMHLIAIVFHVRPHEMAAKLSQLGMHADVPVVPQRPTPEIPEDWEVIKPQEDEGVEVVSQS